MSSTWTRGRHGVPSLVSLISLVVQARPARLFNTRSNRILGERPYAVALRRKVGEKSSSARADRSRSTSTLHFAYAVWGLSSDSSVFKSPVPMPYTLHEDV